MPKYYLPLEHNRQEGGGAENNIINKDMSFLICPLLELFSSGAEIYYFEFNQGYILRGGGEMPPTLFDSPGAFASYDPRLHTPL